MIPLLCLVAVSASLSILFLSLSIRVLSDVWQEIDARPEPMELGRFVPVSSASDISDELETDDDDEDGLGYDSKRYASVEEFLHAPS